MKTGVFDILIVEPVLPTNHLPSPGMAIELKRQNGGKQSPSQLRWLEEMEKRGYSVALAFGAQDAIRQIEEVYGK